jgi:sterol desaturase/sphingolipid hydroxylase (fatty acid hydroxylase superfamily)
MQENQYLENSTSNYMIIMKGGINMNSSFKDYIHFSKKHRKILNLIITILSVGYPIFKGYFYDIYEQYLGNDIILYIFTAIVILGLVLDIIIYNYHQKRTPN